MRHVVVLNEHANGGAGAIRFGALAESETGRALRLDALERAPGAFEPDAQKRVAGLAAWLLAQAERGETGVVACGGDGTVNLVVEAMMLARKTEPALVRRLVLGAVGLGSSNDFHKPARTEVRPAAGKFAARLTFTRAAPHDVGAMEDQDGAVYHFINNASVGLAATANHDFNRRGAVRDALKRTSIDAAILAAALRAWAGYKNLDVRLGVGDQPMRAAQLTNLTIAKNAHFSGSFHYDVAIPPASGAFGVFVCEGMNHVGSLRALAALGRGVFTGEGRSWSFAPEVRVEADEAFPVETDGELHVARRVVSRVEPGALRVCP